MKKVYEESEVYLLHLTSHHVPASSRQNNKGDSPSHLFVHVHWRPPLEQGQVLEPDPGLPLASFVYCPAKPLVCSRKYQEAAALPALLAAVLLSLKLVQLPHKRHHAACPTSHIPVP